MIRIDRKTGTVTWDSFTLHPHLTHDEFVQQYRNAAPKHTFERAARVYQFPKIKLNGYLLVPEAKYIHDKLSVISFDMSGVYYYEDQPEIGIQELIRRSKTNRDLLIDHIGQPHRYNPYCFGFFNEARILAMSEIEALQEWHYEFKWGRAGTYCFYEQSEVLMGFAIGYSLTSKIKPTES